MTPLTWLLTALSIVGVVLNIYKRRSCFAVWAVTNFCWAVIDWQAGIHAQAALFGGYFLLAVFGWWRWRA